MRHAIIPNTQCPSSIEIYIKTDHRCSYTNPNKQSAQNSAGIQTLLDSEREASKIVQKAREFRTKRVREARDEAKKEIEAYRQSKDDEFKKFESEV